VPVLAGIAVTQLASGWDHNLLVTNVGEVYAWGSARCGSLALSSDLFQHGKDGTVYRNVPTRIERLRGRKIKSVACGAFHSLALTEDGRVMSWGHGSYGALGTKETSDPRADTPVDADGKRYQSLPKVVTGLPPRVVAISAGESISMAVVLDPMSQAESLAHALGDLLASGAYSDVQFVVRGEEIGAHKAVLSARSQYYRQMFDGGLG
jgi:alpha-tubulin suppressor-like RCC1 family protein